MQHQTLLETHAACGKDSAEPTQQLEHVKSELSLERSTNVQMQTRYKLLSDRVLDFADYLPLDAAEDTELDGSVRKLIQELKTSLYLTTLVLAALSYPFQP